MACFFFCYMRMVDINKWKVPPMFMLVLFTMTDWQQTSKYVSDTSGVRNASIYIDVCWQRMILARCKRCKTSTQQEVLEVSPVKSEYYVDELREQRKILL